MLVRSAVRVRREPVAGTPGLVLRLGPPGLVTRRMPVVVTRGVPALDGRAPPSLAGRAAPGAEWRPLTVRTGPEPGRLPPPGVRGALPEEGLLGRPGEEAGPGFCHVES